MVSTPSPSPAEAPRNLAELHDATKQTSFIEELAKNHKLTPEEKTKFTEKYKKAITELSEKHKDKKDIVITEINEILKTFKDSLQHEKNDEDDLTDISPNTPDKDKEDVDTGKETLWDREIDEHIKQLSDKIEAKLNAPATPEKTEEVPPETQNDIQTAKKFFENKGVKIDTATIQQWNWLRDLFKKLILWLYGILERFGVNVSNAKAKLEGYKDYISKQKVEETFKVLSGYMGDSVKGITEIKDKEALIDKMEWLGLPLLYGADNLLAGPIMKLIFTGEKSAWDDLPEDFDHDIIKTIRGKYLTLNDNPRALGGMNTSQRLNEIFTIDENRKGEYITRYEDDQEERETKEKTEWGPILGPAEAPKETETITEKILEETEKISKETEKIADDYTKAATPEGKKVKKDIAEKNLKLVTEKQTTAKIENKKILDEYAKNSDNKEYEEKARKSEEAVKKINEIVKLVENIFKKIETEGASELPPLDPTDRNNLIYYDWKLYKNIKNHWDPEYLEMYYENNVLKLSEFGKKIKHKKWDIKSLIEKWCKVIPNWEANDVLRGPNVELNLVKGVWIYVKPEYFAGKLRNIKV